MAYSVGVSYFCIII